MRARFERALAGALRETIDAHGPITRERIGSAAKRILGQTLRNAPDSKPGGGQPVLLAGLLCHCARCGRRWLEEGAPGELPEVPVACAACGAATWRVE